MSPSNKARRGELEMRPPVGLVYTSEGTLVLDPDQQVQHCLRWLFAAFARTGSACATVKAARSEKLVFPRRCAKGPHKGELLWGTILCTAMRLAVPAAPVADV
jgi:DNA invertase Pin-like site-specific DNA recombinase